VAEVGRWRDKAKSRELGAKGMVQSTEECGLAFSIADLRFMDQNKNIKSIICRSRINRQSIFTNPSAGPEP